MAKPIQFPPSTTTRHLLQKPRNRPPGLLNEHIIVPGTISILAGEAGSGKTFLTSFLADCIATGTPFAGMPTRKTTSIYWSLELSEDQYQDRLLNMSLHAVNGTSRQQFAPMKLNDLDTRRAFWRLCRDEGIGFVIIDSLRRAYRGSENANEIVCDFLEKIQEELCKTLNIPVLFVHHSGKRDPDNPNDLRGAQMFSDFPRDIMVLRRSLEDPTMRTLSFKKTTFCPEPPPLHYRMCTGLDGKMSLDFGAQPL